MPVFEKHCGNCIIRRDKFVFLLVVIHPLPGSSRGGSRVIRRWGDGVGVFGKYIFNYRYRGRLETDGVVGDSVVEKRRLNPDGNSARETGARKKRHAGISLSRN